MPQVVEISYHSFKMTEHDEELRHLYVIDTFIGEVIKVFQVLVSSP